jgi:hypothetical protein
VSVRASAKMEATYRSNTPWIFALVTACVFLLTVLTFMLYNCVVEQRQKIVLKSAGTCSATLRAQVLFCYFSCEFTILLVVPQSRPMPLFRAYSPKP